MNARLCCRYALNDKNLSAMGPEEHHRRRVAMGDGEDCVVVNLSEQASLVQCARMVSGDRSSNLVAGWWRATRIQ